MQQTQTQQNLRKMFKTTTAVVENGKPVATTLSIEYGVKPLTEMADPLMITKGSNMKLRIAKAGGNGYSYNLDVSELYEMDECAKICYGEVVKNRLHPEPLGETLCKSIKLAGKTAAALVREEPLNKVRQTYQMLERNISDASKVRFKADNLKQQDAIRLAMALQYKDMQLGNFSVSEYCKTASQQDLAAAVNAYRPYVTGQTRADDSSADYYFACYCFMAEYQAGRVKDEYLSKDLSLFGGNAVIKSVFKTPTQNRAEDGKVHGTGLNISFNMYDPNPFRIELYEKVGDPAKNGGVGLSNATMAPGKKPVAINLSCEEYLYMTGFMLDTLRERNKYTYDSVISAINNEFLSRMPQQNQYAG